MRGILKIFLNDFSVKTYFCRVFFKLEFFWKCQIAYIYPLNNPGVVHLTVFDFTHLSPPPIDGFKFKEFKRILTKWSFWMTTERLKKKVTISEWLEVYF